MLGSHITRSVVVGVFLLFLFAVPDFGEESRVRRITIESGEGGLSSSTGEKLVIRGRGNKMYQGKARIGFTLIEALLASLRMPALSAPEASNLGITREWLHQNLDALSKPGAPNQRSLLDKTFTDLGTVEQILPSLFKFLRFDDYPTLRVTVAFADGESWAAASDSYYPFMLPWAVTLNGQERTTYNADISRAVAALMPPESLNRGRLCDEELKGELADAVIQYVRKDWMLLDVENRAPGVLATLQRTFEVERAEISPYRGTDFGYVGEKAVPHEENLLASLRKPSLQRITADDVVLRFHDGKVEGAESLAEQIAPYEALALSVPWLNDYLAHHPEQKL